MPTLTRSQFYGGLLAGSSRFSERLFASGGDDPSSDWGDFADRQGRYDFYWSAFENNLYSRIHRWAEQLKLEYDLYPAIRSIYSPANRSIEFWAGHIWGGLIDEEAGDGVAKPSALPIAIPPRLTVEAEEERRVGAIRKALAQVWRLSNWQANKDTAARYGAAMGDVALKVIDDPGRRQVYISVIHPRWLADMQKDSFGNCKGYRLEILRRDPRVPFGSARPHPKVLYTEVATKDGERVTFETFIGKDPPEPFDWQDYPDGTPEGARRGDTWTEAYGFVPLFHVQHRDMGLGWGWSELHPSRSKLFEVDDIASKLNDQIRKMADPPWLLKGIADPKLAAGADPDGRYAERSEDDPNPERNTLPTLYGPENAAAQALVAPLDIADCSAHIQTMLAELERDHPELRADMATASGDASGRALRVMRQRLERDVRTRRAGYDDALVRAHKACLSIGRMKEYEGYMDLAADGYALGHFDHSIGDRPVFAVDELDRLDEAKASMEVYLGLVNAGAPPEIAARKAGWSEEEIAELVELMARRAREADPMAELAGVREGQ